MRSEAASYDDVPYPSHAFPLTSPDRLAVVGAVFGLATAPPSLARVLELGCASGGNLLPLAAAWPGSTCLGVDISPRQVEAGRALIAESGLPNVRLEVADLTDFEPEPGAWDYVICHGVWSWVPDEVREGILRVIRRALAPAGVACVSYNTAPVWRMQAGVRDALLALRRPGDDRARAAAHAQHVLDALSASLAGSETPWARLVREVAGHAERASESYLLHEYLDAEHEPFAVGRFAVRARAHDLRYLGDASFVEMLPHFLPPPVQALVGRLCPDIASTEQLLDALRGRSFRYSLLVRQETPVQRDLGRFDPTGFWLSSRVFEEVHPDFPRLVSWHAAEGEPPLWQVDIPWIHAFVRTVREAWPAPVPFELAEAAATRVVVDAGEDLTDPTRREAWRMRVGQLALYAHGMRVVDLHRSDLGGVGRPGERPVAWSWARAELGRRSAVTTLRHETVAVDPFDAEVMLRCDGTRTMPQIASELATVVIRRNAATGTATPVPTVDDVRAAIDRLTDASLMVAP